MAGSCRCSTSKCALVQPAADPGRDHRAERHPGHRAVVGHRHRAAGRHDVRRQVVALGRREHRHVVAERDQRLGEVLDVVLHPAGDVEGVGADDADPHRRGVQVVDEHLLHHVPVLRVLPQRRR